MMQNGDIIHGFRVRYSRQLPEIGAVLWRMEHEKSGADLVWLDRADDNKTFSIAFKTIPQDSTGVFHILEHSVLNGSQKYPVKEPFVELLKSSMATFLNAMTFPDKTMYPISSRNDQDFLNLMDVYLDAVLHPLSVSDPHAFRQEGWHYELEEPEGELRCNGVVYNEMKGAFASPDTVMMAEMNALLFPDNCYAFESGGHPDHIPELTYENYLASHRRFYHPSNAYIFLDGQVDLAAALAKIDGFLAPYDRIDPRTDIPMQAPTAPEEAVCAYEIGPEEDENNKAILAGGWVLCPFDDTERAMAFSVLARLLCGSNEAPLTRALLDAGLAEDVTMEKMDSMQQLYALLQIRNADPAKKEEIWALTEKVLAEQAAGLDHKRLHSILNRLEFTTREKDFGSMPRGLAYAIVSMDSWLYGGDPAQGLEYDDLFASLRKKIDENWFETFLRQALLENPHRARLVMLPSKTLGEEKREREAARLARIKAGWDQKTLQRVMDEFSALRRRQDRADTPEQLSCLPMLRLGDIPEKGMPVRQELSAAEGVTLMLQPVETGGITYLDLYFSLADMDTAQLQKVSFLCDLLGQVATERYSVLELHSEIEGSLGRFAAGETVFAPPEQTETAMPYLAVSLSLLPDKKADAAALLDEILNRSRFDDRQYIFNMLRQKRIALEQAVIAGGNSYAAMRVFAQCSARGAVTEAIGGIAMLRWCQETEKTFDERGEALCRELSGLCAAVFSKNRVILGLTGRRDEDFVHSVLSVLGNAPAGPAAVYASMPAAREGFIIPAEVGFAAAGANLNALSARFSGTAMVAAQLLTFDYLWNQVRVKGGAYGVGLSARASGDVSFTSYRDPSPAATLETFRSSPQALRDVCAAGSIEKYIIGTVAATEPVLSPWSEGLRAMNLYLSGQSGEDLARLRREILATTPAQLTAFADVLDAVCGEKRMCVVGGKAVMDACRELEHIESLQQ